MLFKDFYTQFYNLPAPLWESAIKQFNEGLDLHVAGARICFSKDPNTMLFNEKFYQDPYRRDFLRDKFRLEHMSIFAHAPIVFSLDEIGVETVKNLMFTGMPKIYVSDNKVYFNGRHLMETVHFHNKNFDDYYFPEFVRPLIIEKKKTAYSSIEKISCGRDDFYTLVLLGMARYTATQTLRHIVFSFNQQSLRYTKIQIDSAVNYNLIVKNGKEHNLSSVRMEHLIKTLHTQLDAYEENKDLPNEMVRNILPLCVKTKLMMSGHKDFFEDFKEKRIINGAQTEIREIANFI